MKIQRSCTYLHKIFAVCELKKALDFCSPRTHVRHCTPCHNFSKLTQISLPETYLGSSVPDSLLEIDGYRLARADHPNDTKRGGVCLQYKKPLSV